MRPTQRDPTAPVELTDAATPDFLDAHEVALLAFVHHDDEASAKLRARLALLAPRLADPRFAMGVLDVGRDPHVAAGLGVKRVPAVLVFHRGVLVDQVLGVAPESVLEEAIRARLRDVSAPGDKSSSLEHL